MEITQGKETRSGKNCLARRFDIGFGRGVAGVAARARVRVGAHWGKMKKQTCEHIHDIVF
tara:strand:+ start:97 stop:276 length:180 start_codon:yes stop_codon:yes gene_type:complete